MISKTCYRHIFSNSILFQLCLWKFQCSIPVFEHLLPQPHNDIVLDLLFILCTWHLCAKLWLHTSTTLVYLKETTWSLGFMLRHFVTKTCSAFVTHELPREEA